MSLISNYSVAVISILISVICSYWFHKRGIRAAKPCYQIKTETIIGLGRESLPNEVGISYDGIPVEGLSRTHIIFWNDGNECLSKKKIVDGEPIRLELPDNTKILKQSVLKFLPKESGFQLLNKSASTLVFDFKCLNSNDGAVIEILHDKPIKDFVILGAIENVPNGIRNRGRFYDLYVKKRSFKFYTLMIPASIVTFFAFFTLLYSSIAFFKDVNGFMFFDFVNYYARDIQSWLAAPMGVAMIYFINNNVIEEKRHYPKKLFLEK
jgi:hypothetical protein